MSSTVTSGEAVLPASGSQPYQLTSSAIGGAVVLLALTTNSATVYLGNSGVTSANGFPLAAGGAMNMDIIDASRLFIAGTQGDKVRFLVVGP